MRLKYPGENLDWMAPLVAIAGLYVGYSYATAGSPLFATVFIILGVLSALVWFDQKWVAIPLLVYFVVVAILAVVMMTTEGVTIRLIGRLIFTGYFLFALIRWAKPIDYAPPTSLEPPDWRQM